MNLGLWRRHQVNIDDLAINEDLLFPAFNSAKYFVVFADAPEFIPAEGHDGRGFTWKQNDGNERRCFL